MGIYLLFSFIIVTCIQYLYMCKQQKYNELHTQPKMGLYVTLNPFYLQWSENSQKGKLRIQYTFPAIIQGLLGGGWCSRSDF